MGKDVLKIEGEITHILDIKTGTSKAGKEWRNQKFVINTGEQYNAEVAFGLFGDEKIEMLAGYKIGQTVEVLFNVSSNDAGGRWFPNIDCWKIQSVKAGSNDSVDDDEGDSGIPF